MKRILLSLLMFVSLAFYAWAVKIIRRQSHRRLNIVTFYSDASTVFTIGGKEYPVLHAKTFNTTGGSEEMTANYRATQDLSIHTTIEGQSTLPQCFLYPLKSTFLCIGV